MDEVAVTRADISVMAIVTVSSCIGEVPAAQAIRGVAPARRGLRRWRNSKSHAGVAMRGDGVSRSR
ncbi:hypothetical protein SR870_23545 [Rhodopseudomonas palustris]|uniref:hypothetical protein n=1 Tax=Rhodopseudomonas palustris TaxID=1076 RepID=UPI002ACEF89D|nr:hypothetical protein [Rhodopseudomonas palustris]WQG99605.1 hypothetical protein SR870_23545 [Rhodopseudomonas palustris]